MFCFGLALMSFFCVLTPTDCLHESYFKPSLSFVVLSMSHGFASAINQADCWVCGFISVSTPAYNYVTLPFTVRDYLTVWNITKSAFPQSNAKILCKSVSGKNEATTLAYATNGLLCFESNSTALHLSKSVCNFDLSHLNDFIATVTTNDTNAFSPHIRNITQHSANKTMFICGENADHHFPANWSGLCYFAYVEPALRSAPSPVHNNITSENTDSTQTFFTVLFPNYRKTGELDKICKVIFTVDQIVSSTSRSLRRLNSECASVGKIPFQNGTSKDLPVAGQGRIYSENGERCCSFVPEVLPEVSAILGIKFFTIEMNNNQYAGLNPGLIAFIVIVIILVLLIPFCVRFRHKICKIFVSKTDRLF
ncbi:uncharacterized protein LOC127631711 [Xyrauchen texanus]|uniref:uncharacterized protein LOC127631711 n=1 Tax=Xyrauchen texanus TaxID=154827 RepID=UPI0022419E5E|nr:uncharacterized protein LOC127631711 [Xyrauchen texanus]